MPKFPEYHREGNDATEPQTYTKEQLEVMFDKIKRHGAVDEWLSWTVEGEDGNKITYTRYEISLFKEAMNEDRNTLGEFMEVAALLGYRTPIAPVVVPRGFGKKTDTDWDNPVVVLILAKSQNS